jgi:hypothetical protein
MEVFSKVKSLIIASERGGSYSAPRTNTVSPDKPSDVVVEEILQSPPAAEASDIDESVCASSCNFAMKPLTPMKRLER